jgi:exosortase
MIRKNKSVQYSIVALILFVAVYFQALQILVTKWASSDEYSHAFLVVPIIFYIIWGKRKFFFEDYAGYSSLGLLLIIPSLACYIFALLTQVDTIILLSMFLTIVGILLFFAGIKVFKELATPLLLSLLLIPVPEQLYISLTFPLQLKVSEISEVILRMFHVPMLREGNVMNIPQMSFEVIEACSGLRSVVALLTLSVVTGYFALTKFSSKAILLAASLPLAILVNIIRVVSMILLFYFFRLDLTEGVWHTLSGLTVFLIAMSVLFLLQRVLEFWERTKKESY